uniref:Cytochrome P450 71D10 n=1 Tax=Aegilops tauschii TaxID=37682 RepID=N1R4A8_AEGTA
MDADVPLHLLLLVPLLAIIPLILFASRRLTPPESSGVTAVVASSPDAAREILKTHDPAFASRPVGPMSRLWFQGSEGLVFAPFGDAWRQLRKICTQELLSARRVHSFRPVRQDELGRLLRAVASSSPSPPERRSVNLTEIIAAYIADSTVRAIIGSRPFKGRDACLKLFEDMFRMRPGLSLPDLFPSSRLAMLVSREPGRIKRCRREMLQIMDAVIQEHRERKAAGEGEAEGEDLVDVLLGLQEEVGSQHPLTTENIKFVMIDMFAAGSETATTALQWVMAELMRNPRVRHKAQEEVRRAMAGHCRVTEDGLGNLHYLHMVVKESLRLHVPGPLLTLRQCRSPCQVLGYDVPAGATVFVNSWAIARDPAHWDAPEEFLPERFDQEQGGAGRDFKGTDFEFIPFGAGRRMCPGMTFGLAHIELALAALLFHFDLELPAGVDAAGLDMTEEAGITTRRRSELLVVATTRVPVPE